MAVFTLVLAAAAATKPRRATPAAAPASTAPAAGRASAGAPPSSAASIAGLPAAGAAWEVADAHPSNHPAPPDLALVRDSEKKAQAMAAFAHGLLLEDAAENDAALESFRKAFDLDPSNSDLAIKLAYLLAQKNDPTGGIEVLKDTIKASPKEPLPLIYLSQLYAKYLKKPEAGIKYAEQALTLDPQLYQAYLALFDLLTATNQNAKVEQLLQRAAKTSSTNPQFWLQIGGLAQQAHLKEDGSASSPDAMKLMNSFFAKAAELGAHDAGVQARVGNFYIESKQKGAAIKHYLAALSLKQPADDPVLANAGDKLARALNDAGDRDKAIEVLEKITQENPLRFETYELLGELYQQKGDADRSLENYKHSLLLDASAPSNHIHVADLQIQLKRFDDAVETAKVARAKFPESPEAVYLHAHALSQAKRHTEALGIFAEALSDFESSHEEFLTAQFYFQYGAAAEQAGMLDKAAEMLRKSIQVDPSTATAAQAYNYLGYMWADRSENMDEAGEMIRKALAMDPDNGAFLDSLGWYHYKKGEYDKALTQLLKAAEVVKPEDAVVMEHVGDTYQQLGRVPQALQYWQKALALDAENKKIAKKIESAKQKVSSNKVAP